MEPIDTLEDLFEKADFITLHIPANESTKGLVNKDLLDHAKSLSLLNFARHEVIDSQAILDSLEEKTLINFVTDFPTPELIKRANNYGDVILLPHLGASTTQAEENCAIMAVDQITEFLQSGNITNSVNFPNVHLDMTTDYRIAITNKNVPAVIGKIASTLGRLGLNISDMTNVSKGDIAYNLIDIENKVEDEAIQQLSTIQDIINVRLID